MSSWGERLRRVFFGCKQHEPIVKGSRTGPTEVQWITTCKYCGQILDIKRTRTPQGGKYPSRGE